LKRLVGIVIAGIAAVLLLAFAAKAVFNITHGRPIAHATGIGFVLLRDILVVAVLIIIFGGIALWDWLRYPRIRWK
jgi:hypothetical protein